MNREHYDSKALSTFDIIGSFFVDTFYNHLYLTSRDRVKEGRHTSLTEAYKANIVNYMHGIKKRELYMQVCMSLHEYYQRVTVFSTLTFSDFETKILSQFIPPEYFRDFTEKDKDANLCAVITRTVQEFGEHALTHDNLRRIIDDHRNQQNISLLQDIIADILKIQREEYYVQFAKKINQRTNKVSEEIVKAMKVKIMEETRKRCDVEQDRDRALGIIKQLVQKIADLNNNVARLQTQTYPQASDHSIKDFLLADSQSVTRNSESSPRSRKSTPRSKKRTPAPTPPPIIEVEELVESESSENEEDTYNKQKEMLARKVAERNNKGTPSTYDNVLEDDHQDKSNTESMNTMEFDDDPGFGGF